MEAETASRWHHHAVPGSKPSSHDLRPAATPQRLALSDNRGHEGAFAYPRQLGCRAPVADRVRLASRLYERGPVVKSLAWKMSDP